MNNGSNIQTVTKKTFGISYKILYETIPINNVSFSKKVFFYS